MISDNIAGHVFTGALLGLTAGISPGPLLALVVSETLRNNRFAGFRIAMAPLITDAPIIVLSFIVFMRIYQVDLFMGIISFAGSLFLIFLGLECIRTKGLNSGTGGGKRSPLLKGIIINLLNPHPYLYWITVGTPIAVGAYENGFGNVFAFFITFYLSLVGSKIIIAVLVDRSKGFLNNRIYTWIMRILGISLFVFAVMFLLEGLKSFQN